MPPVTPNQGSRAGLITALVIFVILFVTSTILAIYFGTNWKAEIVGRAKDVAALTPGMTTADLNVEEVQKANQDAVKQGRSGIMQALDERDANAQLITGVRAANTDAVKADTTRTITDVRNALKGAGVTLAVTDDNLLGDMKLLSGKVEELSKAVATAQADTKAAQAQTEAAVKEREAALAEKDKQIKDAADATEEAKKARDEMQTQIAANVGKIQASADDAIKAAQTQTTAAQNELTKVQADLKKANDRARAGEVALGKYRLDTTQALMRPAGIVSRVPSDSICYINLGQGDQVSPGMTFEVYDKQKGLPPLTAQQQSTNELPVGKASIEIIRVLSSGSECRVIRLATATHLVEGDLILNLVYNAHAKFNFVVFGDFDMSNNGQPSAGDADVIRRLIVQWGGRVQDHVTPETDFVVIGKEPVVAALPDNPTPNDQDRHDRQLKAQTAYQDVLTESIRLTVPILGQNRFLYFIGYYDQARR